MIALLFLFFSISLKGDRFCRFLPAALNAVKGLRHWNDNSPIYFLFFGGRSARQCICLINAAQTPNAMLDIPFSFFAEFLSLCFETQLQN
jgi:hypothetical protein